MMIGWPAALALAALQAQPAPPAAAPPASPTEVQGVEVHGRPPAADEKAFVDRFTVSTSRHLQLARWTTPICLAARGMSAAFGDALVAQVAAAAREAGAAVDKPGCAPNALVFVTPDPTALAVELRRHDDAFRDETGQLDHGGFARFLRMERPIQGKHVVVTGGALGEPSITEGDHEAVATYVRPNPSRIASPVVDRFNLSVVVVDAGRTKGLTLRQIAAYVAMLTLAEIDPAGRSAQPTILDLFHARDAGQVAAADLTDWDRAYLKALYRAFIDRSDGVSESQMAKDMKTLLHAPPPSH